MRIKISSVMICCGALLCAASGLRAAEPSVADLIAAVKSGDEAGQITAIKALGAKGGDAATAVEALAAALKDKSPKVRVNAAEALAEIGPPAKAAARELAASLADEDPAVRRHAVKAIIAIHPGPQVMLPLCIKLIEDSDPGVRMRIMNAISDAGPKAVPGLIAALKNEKAAYWACVILRDIGPAAKDAVPALVEAIKDSRPDIRREAVLTLASIGDGAKAAIPQIASLIDDEQAGTAATYALGALGSIPADAEAKVRANAKGENKLLAATSLWALARVHLDDKQLRRETTEQLIGLLKNPNAFVRVAAARALAALPPDPEITGPIWAKAFQDADETTLQYAMDALAQLGAPAVPRLAEALKRGKFQAEIAHILGQIGADAAPATEALSDLVSSKNDRVEHEAVLALAQIGPGAKAAVPALIKALQSPDCSDPHGIVFALGKIGPAAADADAALSALLTNSDHTLALLGAWALVQTNPGSADVAKKTVPVLITGLTAKSPLVRRGAAEALGSLGPKAAEAATALQAATRDSDEQVQAAATAALKSIGAGQTPAGRVRPRRRS